MPMMDSDHRSPGALRLPLAILAVAVLLRISLVFITEAHPLFPPYYYTDARGYHEGAQEIVRAWREGAPLPGMSVGKELYCLWTAVLYRFAGPHPLAPMLFNAVMTGGTVWLWYLLVSLIMPAAPAALSMAMLAVWPSHIFYTSQHLKEAALLALLPAVFLSYSSVWERENPPSAWRRQTALVAGMAGILLIGFFRTHLVPTVAVALAAGGLVSLHRRRGDRRAMAIVLAGLLTLAAAVTFFKPLSSWTRSALGINALPEMAGFLPKATGDRHLISPYSPSGLSEYRRSRLYWDQRWSQANLGRSVATQLFPDLEFRTWWDVAAFLPTGTFYVLFMPLPGLYPLGHNIGRILSSLENTALLVLFMLAVVGAWRARKTPTTVSLLALFCLMVPPSALLEFDLGGASRHRLQFFPFLFPFAASVIADWLKRRGIISHDKTEHPDTGL